MWNQTEQNEGNSMFSSQLDYTTPLYITLHLQLDKNQGRVH